ncbi:hypothetical protein A9Q84_18280 [Halobacteriovorax marinus]|uniref:Uncharacterized protein n=1 Tax=Halobacteriovorax marinus TaxID=97084 RepID=A0A1Y5F305_9BACT|nr:hypothetical protein A9Q84_18280 [Halobacteriovorax marinus]
MKFKFFNKFTDKFDSFLNEFEIVDLKMFALKVSGNHLTSFFEMNDKNSFAFEVQENTITFTDKSKKTTKIDDEKFEHLPNLLGHIREALLFKIENAKEMIHKHPHIEAPKEGELKGEEWIRVSTTILKESLNKVEADPNLMLEGNIFIGQMGPEDIFTIRLQCYNLDFTYSFLANGALNVAIYDDKNYDRGHAKEAAYMGEFYNNRPQILDQIFQVIFEILKNGQFKIFA